jgi:hypothetical protein
MDLHQILLQTWQDGLETQTMIKEAFCDYALGLSISRTDGIQLMMSVFDNL